MARSRMALVSVLLLGGFAAGSAAPIPADARKPAYYATAVGSKWVYHHPGADEEVTEVVTASEPKGGATVITVDVRWRGEAAWTERLSISADAVYRVGLNDETFDPPVCLLKPSARPGDRWEVGNASVFDRSRTTFTALGEEVVEVPAGRFRAAKVEVTYDGREPRTTVVYYAEGIGVVKEVVKTDTGTWTTSRVLTSFAPGGR